MKVGDLYIGSKNKNNLVLFDIPKCEFMQTKISKLISDRNKDSTFNKFYSNNFECEHCGTFYDDIEARCPSCGAPKSK